MSITTKTGDLGTTGLMYNRRVSKCHPQVEAFGSLDELNAALGLARASSARDDHRESLGAIQKDLIIVMGELATAPEDKDRYVRDGFQITTPAMSSKLEHWIHESEARQTPSHGWATPGAGVAAATLDVARTVCRRAERRVCGLKETELNPEITVYLNRLADFLWLLAREAEAPIVRE